MKIIRIDSPLTQPLKIALMADSSLRPHRRPLFLPQGEWMCEIRPAVRIDRLGKAIAARFANRYYSECALVNYLRPESAGDPCAAFTDDAVVAGEWMPVEDAPAEAVPDSALFASTLQQLSANATFKTGDIIILPDVIKLYKPAINQEINIENILEFRIK